MQHIKCNKCKIGISKIQANSHNNLCGECYLDSNYFIGSTTFLQQLIKFFKR